jgi:hypothetical protein
MKTSLVAHPDQIDNTHAINIVHNVKLPAGRRRPSTPMPNCVNARIGRSPRGLALDEPFASCAAGA